MQSELDIKVERLCFLLQIEPTRSLVVLRQVLIKFSMTSHKFLGLDAEILDFHNYETLSGVSMILYKDGLTTILLLPRTMASFPTISIPV